METIMSDDGVTREEYVRAREANGLTPIEQKMADVLADGKMHKVEHLRACLYDNLAGPNTVNVHISGLRRILRMKGWDVAIIRINGTIFYQKRRLPSKGAD